ncbi:hypothetical protein HanHA300_Chr15g0578981 [Helianthus annuus]|nr:hypothetical protein HanHA300_Chr15g0578981 [Helianthus annuus]KAJ0457324.1 hypothetical protein HanIR_Chr15g0772381 [Helianthus annuus]KAJ0649908.1 hypothetical protein HanLR1_Chr15g0589601 [Helianthus annuus]
MLILFDIATGTSSLVSSANKAENRSKNGSLQVVPSGHITKSPSSKSFLIMFASAVRSRFNRTVLIGDMISESLDNEYVTAGIGRPSEVERNIGSRRVRCEHIKRTPV